MKEDYLLIAVDQKSSVSIRFLSLEHAVKESLDSKKLKGIPAELYAEFLLGSVIVGSRYDDQEGALYKMTLKHEPLMMNCETNPKGPFRGACVVGEDFKGGQDLAGEFLVTKIKKNNEMYKSVTSVEATVEKSFQEYLHQSVQTECLFWIYHDPKNVTKSYALWVEKLPQIKDQDWEVLTQNFKTKDLFNAVMSQTDDPDQIISRLFPEPINILYVSKPKLSCSCSKGRILDSLKVLSHEDLVDVFMEGNGVGVNCDYCGKVWIIEDEEVQKLIKVSSQKH